MFNLHTFCAVRKDVLAEPLLDVLFDLISVARPVLSRKSEGGERVSNNRQNYRTLTVPERLAHPPYGHAANGDLVGRYDALGLENADSGEM
jgi:hypothetical protein